MYASCNFVTSDGKEANEHNTQCHIKHQFHKVQKTIDGVYTSHILESNNKFNCQATKLNTSACILSEI